MPLKKQLITRRRPQQPRKPKKPTRKPVNLPRRPPAGWRGGLPQIGKQLEDLKKQMNRLKVPKPKPLRRRKK